MERGRDILRSSVKTTSITEIKFKIGELTYRLFDNSVLRSERRKRIHGFENTAGLLFLASMSEYDELLYEESGMFSFSCYIPFSPDDLLSESYSGSSNSLRLDMQFTVVH